MTTQQRWARARLVRRILLIILFAAGCQTALAQTQAQAQSKPKTQYQVSNLPSLGGTSSGGNSINDQSWVAGMVLRQEPITCVRRLAGRRLAFMTTRVAARTSHATKFSSFSQPCGLWDRQTTRSTNSL